MFFNYVRREIFKDINQYSFDINGIKLLADETEFVELAVSFLRARREIEYLQSFRSEILSSCKLSPLEVMAKNHLSELMISLSGNIVTLHLWQRKIFEVPFDEFVQFTEQIYDLLNAEYTKNSFDLRILDATYLEHMLGADLPYFKGHEYSKCQISDLKIFDKIHSGEVSIKNVNSFAQLSSMYRDLPPLSTNHLFEDNEFRLRKILSNIMENGYPCGGDFIILYNDEMTVRDGTRRLSCLYLLHGDIQIPILRLKFSFNYYSYSMLRKKQKAGKLQICS